MSEIKLQLPNCTLRSNLIGTELREHKKRPRKKQTKERMENKSIVEKVAIEGLCLLGSPLSKLNFPNFIEKFPQKRRKRKYLKTQMSQVTERKTKKKQLVKCKKIVVQLEKPIGVNGELSIKRSENCSFFACPTTYPHDCYPTGYLQSHNKKKYQKVIVSNI
ncbi:hypothetical protein M0813_18995 [Anaeramoeba flamelloides]|uniref:Uncharacterized protein n=1 Tax=Anaeramoeba flamelloides TaxID=1746091 RepID=A0AAV7YIU1_9EUKA|nr:hypothetical protein M0812_23926 [Anaeramoeba flamelloides]KAJ6247465.1 hypothetical protein M0813_18995 [Anaeramoeba flamelloides]|eukprot:Anaeramoba_flamelloidesa573455_25.p1 GENE.a573455_25~~a573455_25.p1  ORF type:complete len:162 (-),score=25.98 a573455_25:40-525(-)